MILITVFVVFIIYLHKLMKMAFAITITRKAMMKPTLLSRYFSSNAQKTSARKLFATTKF